MDELTSFHLKNANALGNSSNKFIIPKFNLNTDKTLKFMIPKLNLSETSLKSTYETSRGPKNKALDVDNWHIDLTSALKNTSRNNKVVKMQNVEQFVPQFVDCEVHLEDEVYECVFDLSNILRKDLKLMMKKRSRFGKVLCRSYVCLYKADVKHEYDVLNQISCFKFDVPSPDDNVQRFVRK